MFTVAARKIDAMIDPLRFVATVFAAPVLDLAIRLFMANNFFWSGWSKFKNYLNGDWAATVYLFTDIHPLPGIPPQIAAVAGTFSEITFSVFLALGLFGRLGAAGLLVMTATIQFIVPAEYGVSNPQHYMWMLLLAAIFIKGPGALSLDFLLRRAIQGQRGQGPVTPK